MLTFATLGPEGSNHHWVCEHYLHFHGLKDARTAIYPEFDAAFEALMAGTADHVLQVAVHPSVSDTVARYRGRAHLIDSFIAPSQPMAVLTRVDVAAPRSLGLQPATRDYVDSSRWETLVPQSTTIDVARGLLDGDFDSGITLARFAEEHPDLLRLDEHIGTVVDPWLVYGRQPVDGGGPVVWPDSPAARLYRSGQTA